MTVHEIMLDEPQLIDEDEPEPLPLYAIARGSIDFMTQRAWRSGYSRGKACSALAHDPTSAEIDLMAVSESDQICDDALANPLHAPDSTQLAGWHRRAYDARAVLTRLLSTLPEPPTWGDATMAQDLGDAQGTLNDLIAEIAEFSGMTEDASRFRKSREPQAV